MASIYSTRMAECFQLAEAPLFEPRYNIAPTQTVAAVRRFSVERHQQAHPPFSRLGDYLL